MKFSTRQSYGLRAMIYLAKAKEQNVSLSVIAAAEHISLKYLEAIFSDFKKAGLVLSFKGQQGGYKLAKPAGKLSVLSVLSALEVNKSTMSCAGVGGKQVCGVDCSCGVKAVVDKLNKATNQTLKQIKLMDLAKS